MEQIENLYNGINLSTIPKIIIDELKTNSNEFNKSYSWDIDGTETETILGKDFPLFIEFSGVYNFFIIDSHYSRLEKNLSRGDCFDENHKKINLDNIYDYLEPFNKGFINGYFEFETSLTKGNSVFNVSNEMLAYKIYARIKRDSMMSNKSGGFTYCTFNHSTKDIFDSIKKENNLKNVLLLTKENVFKSGFEAGEFYKAWKLILNNPTIFEPIFLTNAELEVKELETLAIDLSDTTATEKIIYLQKLGVIDFLRTKQPFNTSVNSLATILSGLTGEKSGTIQSMINPILSKKVDDKNNPLNSKKAVSKVEQQLIKIGFNLNETI